MKLIKFVMAKGENIILPYEQAQKILNSHQQIIQVLDDNGEWTGTTINKAHIICTKEDFEAEKDKQVISKEFRLPEVGESTAGKELRKINITEGMERLFNKLKSVGLFRDYKNYAQYTNRKI